ncbi:MAG: ABC transporter ATP-binding protein [Eubacterium sp.]|nr:ABC transporter ATP-binding protein [Eubacterium sp.]
MIRIEGLTKKFDGSLALDGLDMNVPDGSVYGLVGTNGAGKTTIIKHLAGVWRQDKGTIEYDGENIWENEKLKSRIGVIHDELYFPSGYTLKDMSRMYMSAYPIWNDERFHEMTRIMKLDEKKRVQSFSKGMKKQAMFSLVMSTMPDYLLLDEPLDGLDPIVRRLVWKFLIDDVADRGMTVLVSSHNLKDMEEICDHIGIISNGRMVLERDLDTIKTSLHKIQVSFGDISSIGVSIKEDEKFDPYKGLNILHKETRGTVDLMIIDNDLEEARAIINKNDPVLFDILPLSLEEVFIYELGGENDEIRKLVF